MGGAVPESYGDRDTSGRTILTVTLNPSVDRTVEVPSLKRGGLVRAIGGHVEAGGKGINVTRALAAHRIPSCAVVAVGGAEGRHLAAMLEADDIHSVLISVAEPTRSNISVVEPDGTLTKINERGAALTEEELAQIRDGVISQLPTAAWVVVAGSVPDGVPDSYYGSLVRELRAHDVKVAVDTSGPALSAAIAEGPDLVKPNRAELQEATGREVLTVGDAVAAARMLQQAGARSVLASLGPDGAVLVEPGGAAWHGEAVAQPRSSVGAGDAMLAGFLAGGASGPRALTAALAWAAAAVSLPGTRMPTPEDVTTDVVTIHPTIAADRLLVDHN
ncbi:MULTISPECIES: 1-phosphofructokinase [Thermocrispum]|nr:MULTISPECIES: 1-phosphofructokinase [Thermocrispum]